MIHDAHAEKDESRIRCTQGMMQEGCKISLNAANVKLQIHPCALGRKGQNKAYRLQNIQAFETFFRLALGLSDPSSAVLLLLFAFERLLLPLLLLLLVFFPFACCFADAEDAGGASPAIDDDGISPPFMLSCTSGAALYTIYDILHLLSSECCC